MNRVWHNIQSEKGDRSYIYLMMESIKQRTVPNIVLISDTGSVNTDDEFAIALAIALHLRGIVRLRAIVAVHFFGRGGVRK